MQAMSIPRIEKLLRPFEVLKVQSPSPVRKLPPVQRLPRVQSLPPVQSFSPVQSLPSRILKKKVFRRERSGIIKLMMPCTSPALRTCNQRERHTTLPHI